MHRSQLPNQIAFSISHIEAWAPGVTTRNEWQEWASGAREIASTGENALRENTLREPALQQMQPLLRRHAGRLGRFACTVAYDALAHAGEKSKALNPINPEQAELREVPLVFSSRYGEVSRSVELLSALAAGDELSPSTFGLSVHNAIPGLFSMARKETANSISLAAGDDSAEFGLIEACGLLDDGAAQVLLVVADVPLPPIYESFADTSAEPFGWAALITKPLDSSVKLEWSDAPGTWESSDASLPIAVGTKPLQGALAALAVLIGDSKSTVRVSGNRTWRWSRHG